MLSLPVVKVRHGHRLPTSLAIDLARGDAKLLALLAESINARKLVIASEGQSLNAIAAAQGSAATAWQVGRDLVLGARYRHRHCRGEAARGDDSEGGKWGLVVLGQALF